MSRYAVPLRVAPAGLLPAFQLKVIWYGPPSKAGPMAEKRFKVSANIQIEGDLTADELRAIFLPVERLGGRVSIGAGQNEVEPEVPPALTEEEERKAKFKDRVRGIMEAYREKLGEPVDDVLPALGSWLTKYGEDSIRSGIVETACAAIVGRQQRYDYLREWLRLEHRRHLRHEGPQEGGGK